MKLFGWDDAKNAKLRAERGIGFEDIVFHIERGDLLDILAHPHPGDTPSCGSSWCGAMPTSTLVPFVEDAHTVFVPEDNHPEPKGHEAVPR